MDYHSVGGEQSCFKRNITYIVGLLVLIAFGLAVALGIVATKSSSASPAASPTSLLDANLTAMIRSMRDTSLDPCDDFYQYACDGWIRANPLPGGAPSEMYSFGQITALVQAQQMQILQAHFPFLTTFQDECLDTATIDANGITDLTELLQMYDQTAVVRQFFMLLGLHQAHGFASSAFFSLSVAPDLANADVYRAFLQPGGLSASDPSFYADDGNHAYFTSMVASVFAAAGYNDTANAKAQGVWDLEVFLAQLIQMLPDLDDQGVLIANTTRFSMPDFMALTHVDMQPYFNALSSPDQPIMNIDAITPWFYELIFTAINTGDIPTASLRAYLQWHVMFGNMQFLPAPFRAIGANLTQSAGFPAFAVRRGLRVGATVAGDASSALAIELQKAKLDHKRLFVGDNARALFCLSATVDSFSDLVSHEWVLRDFPDVKKQQATSLMQAIYMKIGERIQTVTWLDTATRVNAMQKWALIDRNVGYSNDWYDYSTLKFAGTLLTDFSAISYFTTLANNQLYLQGVDRSQMPTHDYMIQNAFYNPSTNNINLLAGLIFPPYFDTNVPMMLNFAAYGVVIGHEITHGFDNNGRLFNGTGAYVNWWSSASTAEFNSRAQCLVSQYDAYTVQDGHHVNGAQTLGENIADHGGVNTAYDAYRAYAQPPQQLMSDITNDQLFFLYYAQSWCSVFTPATEDDRLVTDVHSPPRWRVNGPLSNKPEFAAAYGCSAKSKMGRSLTDQRCVLW